MAGRGEQLRLDAPARRAKDRWERRAEQLLGQLRRDGLLDAAAAGYGDALRMAGRDRDHVEGDPDATTWSRSETRKGWDSALSRLVPAPASSAAGGDDADPFADLEAHLRAAAVRDAPDA